MVVGHTQELVLVLKYNNTEAQLNQQEYPSCLLERRQHPQLFGLCIFMHYINITTPFIIITNKILQAHVSSFSHLNY